jgi:intracellular multiplication protein IcmD
MNVITHKNIMPLVSLMGYFSALMLLFLFSSELFAVEPTTSSTPDLGAAANTVRTSLENVASLITAASYVAGIGFAMMGLLKLKAHKDNPSQTALSVPITLLVIAAGLVFLPSIIKTAGATIWGGDADATGTKGGGTEHEEGRFSTD